VSNDRRYLRNPVHANGRFEHAFCAIGTSYEGVEHFCD